MKARIFCEEKWRISRKVEKFFRKENAKIYNILRNRKEEKMQFLTKTH